MGVARRTPLTEATAEWLAGWADGLLTVSAKPDMLRRVIDAFRSGGGEGKPLYLQVGLSWAGSEAAALQQAHEQWRAVSNRRRRELVGTVVATTVRHGNPSRAARGHA